MLFILFIIQLSKVLILDEILNSLFNCRFNESFIEANLIAQENFTLPKENFEQLSLFDKLQPTKEDKIKCLTGNL